MTARTPMGTPGAQRLRAMVEQRVGRRCLLLPSGRMALYLALRHWFRPGDRLLMSPVNDDVVLFVVLAAGLRPVAAPVSPWTGNLDAAAVAEQTWRSVAGVLATNLYGQPDPVDKLRERCDRFGPTLIEDACHAIDTSVGGRPIGTFGAAGAYSLSKHAGAMAGGFLAVEDAADLRALRRRCDELTTASAWTGDVITVAKSAVRPRVKRSRFGGPLWATMQRLDLLGRPDGYRMPLRPRALDKAMPEAPDLDPFDPWIRTDLAGYRRRSGPLMVWWSARRLRAVDTGRRERLAGVAELASTPWASPAVRGDGRQGTAAWPLFRVPLLVRDRDEVVAALARRGVVSGYVYDPPLDDYAGPAFMEPSRSGEAARWFTRHALPADPLDAERIVRVLEAIGAERATWTGVAARPTGPAKQLSC